jgi:hypothetical protein
MEGRESRILKELRKLCFDHPGPVTARDIFTKHVVGRGETFVPVPTEGKPAPRNKRKEFYGSSSPDKEHRPAKVRAAPKDLAKCSPDKPAHDLVKVKEIEVYPSKSPLLSGYSESLCTLPLLAAHVPEKTELIPRLLDSTCAEVVNTKISVADLLASESCTPPDFNTIHAAYDAERTTACTLPRVKHTHEEKKTKSLHKDVSQSAASDVVKAPGLMELLAASVLVEVDADKDIIAKLAATSSARQDCGTLNITSTDLGNTRLGLGHGSMSTKAVPSTPSPSTPSPPSTVRKNTLGTHLRDTSTLPAFTLKFMTDSSCSW